jgi:hypothetical protein
MLDDFTTENGATSDPGSHNVSPAAGRLGESSGAAS